MKRYVWAAKATPPSMLAPNSAQPASIWVVGFFFSAQGIALCTTPVPVV